MGTPFQPVTDPKNDSKSLKKYQQSFTGKDVSSAIKSLLSMMALGPSVVPNIFFSSNTDSLCKCLNEITDSIDNLFKKGGHSLTLIEVQTMLKVVKFASGFLPVAEISKLSYTLTNFLSKDSNIEVRKETFKTILELIRIHNTTNEFYGSIFIPALNLRSFLTQEQQERIPTSQIPTAQSNSNVYCPADVTDMQTQTANTLALLDIFFKEAFTSQENFKLYSPLFYQLVCCILPNVQKVPTLATIQIQYHFNINDIPSKLYHKIGDAVMTAARGTFSRMLLMEDRFLNVVTHFYTEMVNVFGPNDKPYIESFMNSYKEFFFNGQANLQAVLKDRLTPIQFKIVETPGQWLTQSFLNANITNEAMKQMVELIITFYDKMGQLSNELTPSLKSTILTTVTQCSLNFLQTVKNPQYVPYKKELLNTLFILHINWMQFEGDWQELLGRLQIYFDVDMLTVIQNKIEHLTSVLVQKLYNPAIFSTKLPIENSVYITTSKTVGALYEDPHCEPKLNIIKETWDIKKIREMWSFLFKFLDHPLQLQSVETITKNIEVLCGLVQMIAFAEENASLKVVETQNEVASPRPTMRSSQWNMQPTWKTGKKGQGFGSFTSQGSAGTEERREVLNSKVFHFSNSLFIDLQELFLPIFVEVMVRPQSFVTEQCKCFCLRAISRIVCRPFPLFSQEVYDVFTSLLQSLPMISNDNQWALLSSAYDMYLHPNNVNIMSIPAVLESLSRITMGNSTFDDQIRLCSLINSTVFLEYNYPMLSQVLKDAGNPLSGEYTISLINIITSTMRFLTQPQARTILLWAFVHLYVITLKNQIVVDFRVFLDVIIEGVRSPDFIVYTTSLQALAYLSTQALYIPDNVVNYIVDGLCNTILTCPITVDCISFIFDVLSRWMLCYGKNIFTVKLVDETVSRLFQVIKRALNMTEPPQVSDRPAVCTPPNVAAQKFVALLSQVIFGNPTDHGMFKCCTANIPDQTDACFFSYGETTIVAVLPSISGSSHTRVFIRNMYGMYELEVSPLQTISDLGLHVLKDDFKPITQVPWPINKEATGIPKEEVFTSQNLLSDMLDGIDKEDPSLLMCEFPEEIMKVDDYYQYIQTIEEVMNKTIKQEQDGVQKILDSVKSEPKKLDLSDATRDELTEYLQNILNLYSLSDRLLVPIQSTPEFVHELNELDKLRCRLFFKSTVVYVGEEDFTLDRINGRLGGSLEYKQFMRSLGWTVPVQSLDCDPELYQKTVDGMVTYCADAQYEYVFEELVKIPDEQGKTFSEVSSLVHIVWDEGIRPYHPSMMPSSSEVIIVIKPNENGMYGVRVFRKPGFPIVGPLLNNSLVTGDVLATMIRETIVNVHFHYLGNGLNRMDGCNSRFEQLLKVVSFSHLPKDYTLCKELELILEKRNK